MLGVSGGSPDIRTLILAGCSALVAGELAAESLPASHFDANSSLHQ